MTVPFLFLQFHFVSLVSYAVFCPNLFKPISFTFNFEPHYWFVFEFTYSEVQVVLVQEGVADNETYQFLHAFFGYFQIAATYGNVIKVFEPTNAAYEKNKQV